MRDAFIIDTALERRMRDAEKAHNDSMQAWPRGRRYGHNHLLLIRQVRGRSRSIGSAHGPCAVAMGAGANARGLESPASGVRPGAAQIAELVGDDPVGAHT